MGCGFHRLLSPWPFRSYFRAVAERPIAADNAGCQGDVLWEEMSELEHGSFESGV